MLQLSLAGLVWIVQTENGPPDFLAQLVPEVCQIEPRKALETWKNGQRALVARLNLNGLLHLTLIVRNVVSDVKGGVSEAPLGLLTRPRPPGPLPLVPSTMVKHI